MNLVRDIELGSDLDKKFQWGVDVHAGLVRLLFKCNAWQVQLDSFNMD